MSGGPTSEVEDAPRSPEIPETKHNPLPHDRIIEIWTTYLWLNYDYLVPYTEEGNVNPRYIRQRGAVQYADNRGR
jgi:hypothetical protein